MARPPGTADGWVWLAAARPRTLPAAIAPVVLGSALAARDGHFAVAPACLCLGFALLVQIGTNFANDYYDFLKGADTAARVGPRRAVAAGLIAPGVMRAAMIGVFAAAFLVGLGLLHRGGPILLAVGLVSIACGYAYTGGPYPLAYLGLGDLFVLIFFGPVAVLATYYVQAGRVAADPFLASWPVGLLAANILLVNNYRDMETDSVAGKRTSVVRLGRAFARVQFAAALAVALLTPIVFYLRGFGAAIFLPALLAPLAWNHMRRLSRAENPAAMIRLLGDSGKFLFLYAGLFAAGVLIR